MRTSFRLGSLFSGQERRVWVTLRVPSSSAGTIPLGDVRLHYTAANGDHRSAVLGDLPAVAAVIDEGRFVTQLVADSVRRGDYSGARSELEQVDFTELRALGRSPEQTRAWREMQALLDEVEHAAAAPAAEQPARRNLLGKQLYQQGTDERRRGAKRPTPDVSRTQSP